MNEPRTVNQSIDKKPSIGGIPQEQFIPWVAIILITLLIVRGGFKQGFLVTGGVMLWGISSYWGLTYRNSHSLGAKFIQPPNWTRGYTSYDSYLDDLIVNQSSKISSNI
jgi:hypothetical protein